MYQNFAISYIFTRNCTFDLKRSNTQQVGYFFLSCHENEGDSMESAFHSIDIFSAHASVAYGTSKQL